MKLAQDIILRPIISEASMAGAANEEKRKYTFAVAKSATKPEIARAVEELFRVEVEKVNTLNMKGKPRAYRQFHGYTSDWKKAVVTLRADSRSIEFFDGMM
ncbi:MAG: 50S ribosomal protein L23 [Oscillospiraceae bacterium]|jgi:large subunit ribosomal protein L23|nr:50S ribosomal protein L23 [Oscillospiraceae bacterium]